MQIHDLRPAAGSTKKRKILGRGPGSGTGKTSGRGHKGDKARGQVNPNFEGGQSPLHRRLPQLRGFKPINKIYFAIVNVGQLEDLPEGTVVSPETLLEMGLVRDVTQPIKVLGDGELTKNLTVHANKFSKSAIAKLEAKGGSAESIPMPRK